MSNPQATQARSLDVHRFGRLVLKQEKSSRAHMQDSMPSSAKPLSATFFLNMSRNLTAAASHAALSSNVSLGYKINASTPGQLLRHRMVHELSVGSVENTLQCRVEQRTRISDGNSLAFTMCATRPTNVERHTTRLML